MGCSKLGQQPLIRGRTPLCCPRTWSYKYFCSQLRWYGRGKAIQQLDCGNYFLVHSEWNLKSTLLFIPPGFTAKTKNKEISQGSYNTSGEPPWKPNAYLYHSSSRYHCTQEGDHLLRDVPQAAPRHTRARTESFLEWRSVESVSVVTLPSQSLWRQCHAMASFSICHAIFIGFIIVSALFRMYCISVY